MVRSWISIAKEVKLPLAVRLQTGHCQATRERRTAERLTSIRPVVITTGRDRKTHVKATSKDLSHTGMGLIHDVAFEVGRIGVLKIYRLHDDPLLIRAECRWCQPYCQSWFVSGWRFLVEERC